MTTKVSITSAEWKALKWEDVDGRPTSYFESEGLLLQISVLPEGEGTDGNPCNRCDSYLKSTGEVRLRTAWGACVGALLGVGFLAGTESLGTDVSPGCNKRKKGPPYQVVLIHPLESTLLHPIQPSLF